MCVVVALGVVAVFLTLGGCSHHNQGAYVEPPPSVLRHPIKASAVETYPLPTRRQERQSRQSRMPPVRDLPKPTKLSSVKPPPLPVRELPKPTKLSSAEPPPLPVRKPQKALEAVGQEGEAKFKAAQAKAAKVGVENLTERDIDGLSFEQIKQLRGY
jgi:hypothetical protein